MWRVEHDRTQRARMLRKNATRHELKLWSLISRLRPKFTRQLPIGPYTVDFACRQARLIVELDGSQHAETKIPLPAKGGARGGCAERTMLSQTTREMTTVPRIPAA
ncbi:MAG TPA: DUF559 domain-containing protein [Sphingomicrobium sp.]|nr:DUF559 domain-containing protein [Sphingomicrobium sp.]